MDALASPGQLRWSFVRWTIVAVPAVMLLGMVAGRAAGSAANNPWFEALAKPELQPPGWVFGVVWPLLYALMGVALASVLSAKGARWRAAAAALFTVHLALNLAWPPLFFRLHRIDASFWLIIATLIAALATAVLFGRIRRIAGWLLVPYLAWLTFAAGLNWKIGELNPDGGARILLGAEVAVPAQ